MMNDYLYINIGMRKYVVVFLLSYFPLDVNLDCLYV